MSRIEFESGQSIGQWTVLKFDKVDELRRRRYICKCSCGSERSLVASRLKAGKTNCCKSCRQLHLIGQKFGDWNVLSLDGIDLNNKTLWKCRCSCGNESIVIGANLISGKSKCCFDCGHNKKMKTHTIPSSWWYKTMDQGRRRGHSWSLTEDEALEVLKSQDNRCLFSGLKLKFNPMTASIDRVNNSKGYFVDNIQWVHKHINIMKHRYSNEYFVEMCQLVAVASAG